MKRIALTLVGLLAAASATAALDVGPAARVAAARELIVVVTPDWNATAGRMQRFVRAAHGAWRAQGESWPVMLGRTGLAWDDSSPCPLKSPPPSKREGDGKSPAGALGLTTLFGKPQFFTFNYPFLKLSPTSVGVDDPSSSHYNQILDGARVAHDWDSAERMWVQPYDEGIVVDYNLHPVRPGRGSCIFVHIGDQGEPTSGCTAMAWPRLRELCDWLRTADHPTLVQLPRAAYAQLREAWKLPLLGHDLKGA